MAVALITTIFKSSVVLFGTGQLEIMYLSALIFNDALFMVLLGRSYLPSSDKTAHFALLQNCQG